MCCCGCHCHCGCWRCRRFYVHPYLPWVERPVIPVLPMPVVPVVPTVSLMPGPVGVGTAIQQARIALAR